MQCPIRGQHKYGARFDQLTSDADSMAAGWRILEGRSPELGDKDEKQTIDFVLKFIVIVNFCKW